MGSSHAKEKKAELKSERSTQFMGLRRNKHYPLTPQEHAEDSFRRSQYQSARNKQKLKSQRHIEGLERFKGYPLPSESPAKSPASRSGSSSLAPVLGSKILALGSQYPAVPFESKRPSIGRYDRSPAYGWGSGWGGTVHQHPARESKRKMRSKAHNSV